MQMQFGLAELGLQGVDLGAEIVGQAVRRLPEGRVPGGGVQVHVPATRGSRRVSVFMPVSRRAMTWAMAQWTRDAEEAGRCS